MSSVGEWSNCGHSNGELPLNTKKEGATDTRSNLGDSAGCYVDRTYTV